MGKPLKSQRAAHQVYDSLRDEILSKRMVLGAITHRQELQERFGLSLTPVRDSVTRLSEDGLVDVFAQSATLVSLIDVAKAR